MRLLIQRVKNASVSVGGDELSRIGQGLLVLVGVGVEDTDEDMEYLAGKLVRLRIFDDGQGVMNLDVRQVGGEVLVVSQFTLQFCWQVFPQFSPPAETTARRRGTHGS